MNYNYKVNLPRRHIYFDLTFAQKNLGQKECKYFNKGVGECPFGNKCFYQHADKDGRSAVYI